VVPVWEALTMYNFLFDKKSLTLLLAGLGLSGVLLFCAGLLVGVQFGLPTSAAYVPPRVPAVKLPARAALPKDRPCTPCAEMAAAVPAPIAPEEIEVEEPASEPVPPAIEEPHVQVASLPAPAPLAVTAEEAGAFSLQVGAFRKAENSDKVIQDLESRGYQPYVVAQRGSRSRVLHTVRVGRYADREEAQKAPAVLRQRDGIAAVVIGS
jgi:cell division septation protein DedD